MEASVLRMATPNCKPRGVWSGGPSTAPNHKKTKGRKYAEENAVLTITSTKQSWKKRRRVAGMVTNVPPTFAKTACLTKASTLGQLRL